jgi:hypothetical protein
MVYRSAGILIVAAAATGCSDRQSAATEPMAVRVYALTVGSGNFGTHLSGAEETPPKPTLAQGQAVFRLSEDGTELSYRIIVADIENATMSHIHLGQPGVAGPPVLWLYPSTQAPQLIPGRSQGILGEGVATAADLVGPLAGQPLSALVDSLRAGAAYANVHTAQFPAGEIRGQVQ